MRFSTDEQTLNDLNILGTPGKRTVYDLFNHTYTRGGATLLEQMFLYPLADVQAINQRSSTFQFFARAAVSFPFKTEDLDSAEHYLNMTEERTRLAHGGQSLAGRFGQFLATDVDYQMIMKGITALLELLHVLNEFAERIRVAAIGTAYEARLQEIKDVFAYPDFSALPRQRQSGKLSHSKAVDYDQLLRFRQRAKLGKVLSWIYHLDVCLSVAEVARKHGFVFPEALDAAGHEVHMRQLYHPLLKNAVANDIAVDPNNSVIFLTGANMAGKSTFMKSLGIAMYLAHMGFPVAAKEMRFSVRSGIYTTINLPDDLSSGNSHFYAEVLRLKKIAKALSTGKDLFIIFDELFRGTNVSDACEGTIAITEALSRRNNCMFLVSTHIIEAGAVLKTRCDNINFVYLPTFMEGNQPVYTYRLRPGITSDRHGMVIINNERILEIIRSRNHKNAAS